MALFGFTKDRKNEGSAESVLAYLEEALRRRTPFVLADAKSQEYPATLHGLDEAGGTATFLVQGFSGQEKGAKFTAVFMLDGLRIGGSCRCLAVRTGQADLSIPEDLAIHERRRHPRARLNPKEGATLTALTGLFEGIGLTGVIENLSEGGARVRLERAMEAKGEKKLGLHTGLVARGHGFDLLRISKLPKIPGKYECPGKAAYMDGSGGNLSLGVTFAAFPAEALAALRSLVSSRISSTPSTLPPKSRRSQEEAPAPQVHEPHPTAVPPPPHAEAPAPAPLQEAPAPPAEELPPPEATTTRNLALLRLKKRTRTVLLATPSGEDRARLAAFLAQEGYGRILQAGTLGELLGALEEPGISLLVLDGGVEELQGLDLVDTLGRVHDELPAILLALEELSPEDVVAAQEAGVGHLVVKPFALDEEFAKALEGLLGL